MKVIGRKLLGWLLALALVMSFSFGNLTPLEAEADSTLATVQPVVAVSGDGLISNGTYTGENVSSEKSYTMDELKALDTSEYVYSAINTYDSLSVFRGEGASLKAILAESGMDNAAWSTTKISIVAPDGYTTSFDPAKTETSGKADATTSLHLGTARYFFPNFNQTPASEGGKSSVETILAWKSAGKKGNAGSLSEPTAYTEPSHSDLAALSGLKVMTGQITPGDYNNPLWNGDADSFRIQAGDKLEEVALTMGSKTYTRADMLMMKRADNEYSYSTKNGDVTDYVRGVPMSILLEGYDDDAIVTFETADGYAVSASGYTVKKLIDNDYMLAYEKGTSASNLSGVYDVAKNDNTKHGFLRLYGSDENGKPASMINKITVTSSSGEDYSNSPYKHITNGGQGGSSPYNIDSITGATLTVEGPGVKSSVPVSVRDLEGRDAGIKRADYTDKREGSNVTRTYEGIDLYYILHNMQSGDNGIQMTDRAAKVLIKNRNRNTIATFTTGQIEEAHNSQNPILVAYGTSLTDGTNIRPFVFDKGAGADQALGNEDGCIKLVYDKSKITGDNNDDYTKFGNMAYIYVAEAETPGYKHDKAPYQSADISNYIVTVTGEKIGREILYTVKQLEDMVEYGGNGKPDNNGMGYRDEYSLANSNYWYVNEYEGVQLWKLLLKSGLDPSLSTDDKTLVSSTATDGYAATDKFTIKQVADPDSFGFYEKNPADLNDGTYKGNENIRQGDDVSTGDKLRVGYPVLVAYGVNGYPYVEKTSQEGYLSGLQNDGGPLRIISGKLKYTHANGSSQAKFLDKILVGEDKYHYSTHKYHSDDVYKNQANSSLQIKVLNGADAGAPELLSKNYSVGDLEELIYGGALTNTQLKDAKVKAAYGQTKNGNVYSDIYEGLNLSYFLTDIVEIPGYKGTVTFSNGTDNLTLNLEDVLNAKGKNSKTGMDNLRPILAYGKNGTPLVGSKDASDGYVNTVTLAEGTDYENTIDIKNNGGPLQLTFPQIEGNADMSEKTVTGITSITINLSPDKYAHTDAPYDTYKNDKITISGEGTRLTEAKEFTVSELEGKQNIAFTGDYSMLNSGGTKSQARYRGINLYSLLTSTAVGLKNNADKVIITDSENKPKEFSLGDIRKMYTNTVTGANDLPVLLAYGAGKTGDADMEDGKPLVANNTSEGYVEAYGNAGGPIRLVVGQTAADDVNSGKNIKFVKSIEVTASDMTSWNHNSSEVFRQYLTEKVNLSVVDKDGKELYNKDYTVEEIESNESLVERVTAQTTQSNEWEGIDFWKFVLQETGEIAGIEDPIKIDVFANDGYNKNLRADFDLDALQNGIKDGTNRIPILLGYAVDGYPLTTGNPKQQATFPNGEGYDSTVGNNGGPIRLITHGNQGASISCVTRIQVTVGESTPVVDDVDFTIKGLDSGDIKLKIDDIKNTKNSAGDIVGQAEASYTTKGITKTVRGVLLKHLLAAYGVNVENTDITLHTPDNFEDTGKGASYKGITLKQAIEQDYFLAYQEKVDGEWKDIDDIVKGTETHTNLRMYRNYCAANGLDNNTEWLDECNNIIAVTLVVPEVVNFKEYATSAGVRSTWMDAKGNLYVGTYGGGLGYKMAGQRELQTMTTEKDPSIMKTDFTSAVAADKDGGVWVSQNASYTDPTNNQGVLYIKGNKATQYKAEDNPATIPDNYVQAIKVDTDGSVWFGSFGGVTIYDPKKGTWTTYSKANSDFPATSVNTITLDGKGGAWLGFYPDGAGTQTDPYVGGFCHITKDGTVTEKNVVVGEMTSDNSTSKLAQAWVRSIAIDQKNTVWVVAAGTNLEDNEGGTIWKMKNGTGEPTKYTGKEIFGDYLDGSKTTEVRVVSVDKDGNLWFGTSADGILVVSNPKLVDGKMVVDAQYAKETGSWSADNMNNVYSIDFWNDGTAYVGSAGGIQVLGTEPKKSIRSSDIKITGMKTVTYNGKARTFKLKVDDTKLGILTLNKDYTVKYSNNKNAGTAKITITAKGDYYTGTVTKTFKIKKAAQKFTAKGKTKKVKASKLKKKARTVTKAITVKKNKGKVTYKKAGGSAKLKISKAGKIKVSKGTKKGTYKIKVLVKAAATKNYKAANKKVTVKIKVR